MLKLPPTTNVPWKPDVITQSIDQVAKARPEALVEYLRLLVLHLDAMYSDIASTANKNAQDAWDDMRVSLASAKIPAANFPDWVKIKDDGAGSVGIYGYAFADGEYAFLTTQISHRYKEGTLVYPHIHFMTTTNVSPADNFGIGLEYAWMNVGDTLSATTLVTQVVSTGVNSSYKEQKVNIPPAGIDGTGKKISSMFLCRLYRYAASVDNYAGDVIITDFDLHYQTDGLGSTNVTSK